LVSEIDKEKEGKWMHDLLLELYPYCRSLTGEGNRDTLSILKKHIPLVTTEVPSGTSVFDWQVPQEWVIRDAYIVDPSGKKIANFKENNLHLVGYSEPVNCEIDLEDLNSHIYTLEEQPDLIPYVTKYYNRGWGFCMTHAQKSKLAGGRYKVVIDSEFIQGSMTLAELSIKGESEKEIIISSYFCHPSMANDNLSGIVVATALFKLLQQKKFRKFSYRLVLVPETIGSIVWLSINKKRVISNTEAGIVLSCIGNDAPFTYKSSRKINNDMDKIIANIIKGNGETIDFTPVTGSDERQYCSPGFNLPIGLLSRSYPGTFPFYHTSGDTPEKTPAYALADSLSCIWDIIDAYEFNSYLYERTDPYCEPQLSKRKLYHAVSVKKGKDFDRSKDPRSALMWILNYCDGQNMLVDIANLSGMSMKLLVDAAERATEAGILSKKNIT